MRTEWPGDWHVKVFRSRVDDGEHFAFVCGQPDAETPTLVRVQHRADTFDIFTTKASQQIADLRGAMATIGKAGVGAIIYLDRSGSSALDLLGRHLGEDAQPTAAGVPAHQTEDVNKPKEAVRNLGIGAQILLNVGIRRMRVMTNRPKRIIGTDAYGLEVVEQVSIPDPDEGV